jgi:hypothetical protein
LPVATSWGGAGEGARRDVGDAVGHGALDEKPLVPSVGENNLNVGSVTRLNERVLASYSAFA